MLEDAKQSLKKIYDDKLNQLKEKFQNLSLENKRLILLKLFIYFKDKIVCVSNATEIAFSVKIEDNENDKVLLVIFEYSYLNNFDENIENIFDQIIDNVTRLSTWYYQFKNIRYITELLDRLIR